MLRDVPKIKLNNFRKNGLRWNNLKSDLFVSFFYKACIDESNNKIKQ